MLPASWEEYLAKLEQNAGKTSAPIKRHQPRAKRHQSAAMRRVSTQTANTVRAAYQPENDYNKTPLARPDAVFTRNLGGNCEPKNELGWSGKATRSR